MGRMNRVALVAASVGIVATILAPAGAQPGPSAERASVSSGGEQANDNSFDPSISNDGNFIVYESVASNLVNDDTNEDLDVFLYDLGENQTYRVSEATSGAQANRGSDDPVISGNGRFVAFETEATNLSVKLDRNGQPDIYVHNRLTGQTNRINIDSKGKQANGASYDPDLSDDGRYVAFFSEATNLAVKGDHNGSNDVFVYDRRTRKTNRVSVNSAGKEGNGDSYQPSISGNGRYVAFTSRARNLVDNDRNSAADVFVYDREKQKTTRISVASSGQQANEESRSPAISSNGRFIAFVSSATNLVQDDTNAATDVFVHDMKTGRTRVASVSSAGELGNGDVYTEDQHAIGISPDGQIVTFISYATNLVPGDINGQPDVFVHDRSDQTTERVGRESANADVTNGFVTFDSSAPDETMGDTNQAWDVFVRGI